MRVIESFIGGNEGEVALVLRDEEGEEGKRIDLFEGGQMGEEIFNALFGEDEAEAILPEAAIEVVGILLLPTVVLP